MPPKEEILVMKTMLLFFFASIISIEIAGQIDSISGGKLRAWYEYTRSGDNIIEDKNLEEGLVLEIYKEDLKVKGKLINKGTTGTYVLTQDGSLIIIAEAKKKGSWEPIEFWIWSDCGNSYDEPLLLASKEYVHFGMPEFTGDFQTEFRLKICTGEEIIHSNVIPIEVSETLFENLEPSFKETYYWSNNFFIEDCSGKLKEVMEELEERKLQLETIRNLIKN